MRTWIFISHTQIQIQLGSRCSFLYSFLTMFHWNSRRRCFEWYLFKANQNLQSSRIQTNSQTFTNGYIMVMWDQDGKFKICESLKCRLKITIHFEAIVSDEHFELCYLWTEYEWSLASRVVGCLLLTRAFRIQKCKID